MRTVNPRPTLVGVDGSDGAARALDWATADAAARGAGLTAVCDTEPWPTPWLLVSGDPAAPAPFDADLRSVLDLQGQQILDGAVAQARDAAPGLPIERLVVHGDPAAELLRLAATAEQVVLGSRGHGGFAGLLLGSVATHLTMHAPCPVVVVRGRSHSAGPVIVGVDGSPSSETALEYGFAHAARHGLKVQVLHAYPEVLLMPPYPLAPVNVDRLRDSARAAVRDALGRWAGKFPDVPADSAVASGPAARRLVEASEGSALVVVGRRGHGGFAGLLLGSVSQALVRHAHCPVAVVC